MKAINYFITVLICLFGGFFFTPLGLVIIINIDGDFLSLFGYICYSIAYFSGILFTKICAKKFNKWFDSHIKQQNERV